jgi:nucleoside-diphosphate-sugar epimerase
MLALCRGEGDCTPIPFATFSSKVSPSAIAGMSSVQYLDGSKATRELGYRPEVSVDETIRRTFEWFRSQGKVIR